MHCSIVLNKSWYVSSGACVWQDDKFQEKNKYVLNKKKSSWMFTSNSRFDRWENMFNEANVIRLSARLKISSNNYSFFHKLKLLLCNGIRKESNNEVIIKSWLIQLTFAAENKKQHDVKSQRLITRSFPPFRFKKDTTRGKSAIR